MEKNYHQVGEQLAQTAVDSLDSLDMVEVAMKLEEKGEIDSYEMAFIFSSKSGLSVEANERNYVSELEAILRAGVEVKARIFGIPITIIPASEAETPPDAAGVREPRGPILPSGEGHVALKPIVSDEIFGDSLAGRITMEKK